MRFERLRIQGLRCLDDVDITPARGLNVLLGPNGAGKTSVLEAAYLLSHARSFRSGSRDALLQRGAEAMHIYGEVVDRDRHRRLGLGRKGDRWEARIDGEPVDRLGELVQSCAVICFEPGSHALIAGAAEERRRFLDWGVFHVEHRFLSFWQRYRRALKQRNALLRGFPAPSGTMLEPWEREMDEASRVIDALRATYMRGLEAHLREVCARLLPELGDVQVSYRRGWDERMDLHQALEERRERDRQRGHTTLGIHRADWRPGFEHAPQREHFSRGQEKLCALACHLAQARLYAEDHGEWPVICLDDLASELDATHRQSVVDSLFEAHAQVFVTGTDLMEAIPVERACMFHVEHGRVGHISG